jgi:cysteine desulfurase/selenocysteine lyase
VAPHHLAAAEPFSEVPRRLKRALGRLLGAPPEDVILGNSASYGLHLLANGIPWRQGDEVLVIRGDFPADILPWLGLERRGVRVRQIETGEDGLRAEDLERHLGSATKVFCATWVDSFTGRALDLEAVGAACRDHGVLFVVNAAQALGARPLDLSRAPVDAMTGVGFKWLCGPYGTGFCWMTPSLRASLEYNQAYWLALQTADDLGKEGPSPPRREDLGARAYDVFGTANFFNFVPWTAAVEYLLEQGIERVAAYDEALVDRLVEGMLSAGYRILSPREGGSRSTLVVVSHRDPRRNERVYAALAEHDVYVALRRGNLRLSPHLYNTPEDVDRALEVMARL